MYVSRQGLYTLLQLVAEHRLGCMHDEGFYALCEHTNSWTNLMANNRPQINSKLLPSLPDFASSLLYLLLCIPPYHRKRMTPFELKISAVA